MTIISVSLPDEQAKKLKQRARQLGRPKSQVVQDALKQYEWLVEWREITAVSHRVGSQLGLDSDDDVERLFG